MSDAALTAKRLGEFIFRTLGVTAQDDLEIQRDKLNGNRILVIRCPKEEQKVP